jgi:iron complex outermembrane receptor protein
LFKLRAFSEWTGKSRISLTLSSQYNQRKEFDITRSATELPQLELDLSTHMADLVYEHFANQQFKGSMGINAMYQSNFINYRYFVPNYQSLDYGLWLAEKMQQGKWQFELGLRYDQRRRYDIRDNDKPPFDLTMGNPLLPGDPYGTRNFSGMSGTGVAAYTFNDNLRMSFTVSTAWRSPQVNELFSNGLHHGAARIEKGDPALNPERAISALANLVYNKDRWEIEWGLYSKSINDFIYLKPTYPALLTIRGAFPSFAFAQTNAHLAGSDLSMAYGLNAHLKAHAKASLLRAYDQSAKTWLIQMPADRYEAELEYDFIDGKKWKQSYLKLGIQHVTEQTRVPPSGNIEVKDANGNISLQSDYIPPPPAYTLVNMEAGSGLMVKNRKLELVFTVSNLFNTSYRDYLNAFRYFSLDRGRNIAIKMKLPLF